MDRFLLFSLSPKPAAYHKSIRPRTAATRPPIESDRSTIDQCAPSGVDLAFAFGRKAVLGQQTHGNGEIGTDDCCLRTMSRNKRATREKLVVVAHMTPKELSVHYRILGYEQNIWRGIMDRDREKERMGLTSLELIPPRWPGEGGGAAGDRHHQCGTEVKLVELSDYLKKVDKDGLVTDDAPHKRAGDEGPRKKLREYLGDMLEKSQILKT
ncbi:hypothetical protein EVAR_56192_1 [Eumeta japonica]|uniref:Uncharacterized protein n=1 Tax=Eumeta variegata TaxID=151549 RepID=A0A4C1Y5A8_EUMVA|nr:hypothetical protein EVAR_56192_1 [Eumeta japonica]